MKQLLTLAITLALTFYAQAQIKVPAASPLIQMTQEIGLTKFNLSYSRPGLHHRIAFGSEAIVPYDRLWRTGANAATTLAFDSDIKIQGELLQKGNYAILTTPGEKNWQIHFFKYIGRDWTKYTEQSPILTILSTPSILMTPRESLMIYFDELNLQSGDLVIEWDRVKLSLPIELDEHEKIMADINRKTGGPSKFELYSAALYMHESQTDLPQALAYIQQVTKDESALFFMVYREALILRDLKKNKEALQSAKRAKELSAQAGNEDLVRLTEQLISKLGG